MAVKNLVGNPNGVLETEVNNNVSKSGFGQGISPSHFFTANEGEIKIQYDELLEPNSEIRISNQYLIWQSPLVSRNLTNQRVRTHYIAQSIKNMWADYRSFMFGGRYGDFVTPELHFKSSSGFSLSQSSSDVSSNETIHYNFIGKYRTSSSGSYSDWEPSFNYVYYRYALSNSFLTFFGTSSLGEALGFQTDVHFTDLNTPNPWPFMAYLNFYKWFVANKYVLRGDTNYKKIWFPDNEDHFKFECGSSNKSTGVVGRFFSPESGLRSGVYLNKLKINIAPYITTDLTLHVKSFDKVIVTASGEFISASDGSTYSFDFTDEYNPEIKKIFEDTFLGHLSSDAFPFTLLQWLKLISIIKEMIFDEGLTKSGAKYYFLDLFETRYMNFNKDYFTGGLISPLIAGDYPSIVGSGSFSDISAETTLTGGSVSSDIRLGNVFNHVIQGGEDLTTDDRNIHSSIDYKNVSGQRMYFSHAMRYSGAGTSAVDNEDVTNDVLPNLIDDLIIENTVTNPTASTVVTGTGSFSFGVNIPMLRLLSSTNEYLEALARSDGDYRNMVLAIYGVKPTEVSEAPIYLGGSSSFIQTENIFQTSPTDGQPLGTASQTGFGGNSSFIGSYFAKDTTVVLGFISVVPEIFYYQGVPKKWVMRHKEEHQNPKFNGISMQAVENRELYVSGDDSVDTLPFSYAPAWEFMRHRQNRLSGLLKPHFDPSSGILLDKPFTQMTQSRGFNATPDFNTDFVSTKNNISTEHLFTQNTDIVPEFTIAIKNNVEEILPITRSGVPQRI